MKPEDIICLVLILLGVFFIVRSLIHKHKGMWNFGHEDFSDAEPWDSLNPKIPHSYSRRGIDSPHDENQIGLILIAMGILFAIQFSFGLRAFAVGLLVVCAINVVYNIIMKRFFDEYDDDDISTLRSVNFILSGFVTGVGLIILLLT